MKIDINIVQTNVQTNYIKKKLNNASMIVIYTMPYYDFASMLACVHLSPMSTHAYILIHACNVHLGNWLKDVSMRYSWK